MIAVGCIRIHDEGMCSMRVLMAIASKHGSTEGIAQTIAAELHGAGINVEIYDAESAPGIGGYDAAVIGSAIYMGRWMAEAREFVELHHRDLQGIPVWLFSSGPIGDAQPAIGESADIPNMEKLTNARSHRTFAGKLDRATLGMGERLVSKVVRAPEGDFRDWDEIQAWAREIAGALETRAAVSAVV
jgi:menaquinone-dependent protoporphyrinogen oxidase